MDFFHTWGGGSTPNPHFFLKASLIGMFINNKFPPNTHIIPVSITLLKGIHKLDMYTLPYRKCLQDNWVSAGRPEPRTTSRFDTRVDYVFSSESFNKSWTLESFKHVPHNASDHSFVVAQFVSS